MTHWDITKTKDAVRDIVEERPDHVDPNAGQDGGCQYVIDGTPSCIVGVFLVEKVGLDPELVHTLDTGSPLGSSTSIAATAAHFVVNNISKHAIRFLQDMQREQDRGRSWGEALRIVEHIDY